MKKCPYCAEEIQDDAIVCRYCGRDLPGAGAKPPITPPAQVANQTAQKKSSKTKNILVFIGVLLGLCMLCRIGSAIYSSTPAGRASAATSTMKAAITAVAAQAKAQTETAQPTKTPTPTPTPKIDRNIKALMDGAGLSKTEAEAAFGVLKSVGFDRVEKITFIKETEGMRVYSAALGYTTNFLVTFVDNEIFGISQGNDFVLYDRDAGGVLDKVTNYVLDTEDRGLFMYLTEEVVKRSLKSPSTAKFPGIFEQDQWRMGRDHDIVTVKSWVDAQNSFGAVIRAQFTAQFSYSSQDLLYLELDGQVLYGSLQPYKRNSK